MPKMADDSPSNPLGHGYGKVWQAGFQGETRANPGEPGRTSLREMFKRPIAGETALRQMLQQHRAPGC